MGHRIPLSFTGDAFFLHYPLRVGECPVTSNGKPPPKPGIPNIVDHFGRTTADRLVALRDQIEPGAPKKLRDAIAECRARGAVFNYEAGVMWLDD